jgi:hypothetical protein
MSSTEYELTTLSPVTSNATLGDQSVVFGSAVGQGAPPNTPPDVIQLQALRQYITQSDHMSVLLVQVFS